VRGQTRAVKPWSSCRRGARRASAPAPHCGRPVQSGTAAAARPLGPAAGGAQRRARVRRRRPPSPMGPSPGCPARSSGRSAPSAVHMGGAARVRAAPGVMRLAAPPRGPRARTVMPASSSWHSVATSLETWPMVHASLVLGRALWQSSSCTFWRGGTAIGVGPRPRGAAQQPRGGPTRHMACPPRNPTRLEDGGEGWVRGAEERAEGGHCGGVG
jgi:hypothetical protein